MKIIEFITAVSPQFCPSCGEASVHGGIFCGFCASKWTNEKNILCNDCGKPHCECVCKRSAINGLCSAEYHLVPYFPQYDSAAKALIIHMKNKRSVMAAAFAAGELAARIRNAGVICDSDTVICHVPRRPSQKRITGTDQSEEYAKYLARELKIERIPILISCSTLEQKGLSSAERELNAEHSYSVRKKYVSRISYRRVILLDDIVTSGSTVAACAKLLHSCGASEVICLSVAVTV